MIEIAKKNESGFIELRAGSWGGSILPGRDLSLPIDGPNETLSPEQQAEIAAFWTAEVAPGVTRAARFVELDLPAEPEASLAEYAAEAKWRREIGGILWNGWPVATDREVSQPKVHAVFSAVTAGLRAEGSAWKFADGVFRNLSNAQAAAMAAAVFAHVEACYAKEAEVLDAIAAEQITTAAEIDAAFETVGGEI